MIRRVFGAWAVVALLATASGPGIAAEPGSTLTVFAAASLSESFTELGRMLEQSHPGLAVRFSFAGSQQLSAQIEQGAAADLFASADDRWMAWLADRKLIDGEPKVFARNQLVLIVPKTNPARIGKLQDLTRRGVKLVIGGNSVPVGVYSREALRKLTAMPGYPADYAPRVLANVVSEEENVKSVVSKVQLGEADAGFVYRSDVSPAVARFVKVLDLPSDANVIANYPIAVVHAAKNADAAQAFLALLDSAEGRAVLERHKLMVSAAAP